MAARWVSEEVVERVEVQVAKTLERKQVVVEADIRSPGLQKPMRRSYRYQSTPEAAEALGEQYARLVHEANVMERSAVEKEFEKAEKEQTRLNNQFRKRNQYERNRQEYGTARKPAGAAAKRKPSATPATVAGPPKQARAEPLPCVSVADAGGASVAQELAWEGL